MFYDWNRVGLRSLKLGREEGVVEVSFNFFASLLFASLIP